MKAFLTAVLAAAKDLKVKARAWLIAGASLLVLFALVGALCTVKIWGPVAVAAALLYFAFWALERYERHIPPARKSKIVETISAAVASALAGDLPYKFDSVTAADVAYSVQIMRDGGADMAAVSLLVMEKHPEEINLRLLEHVFQGRFNSFCRSPGFSESAYSPAYPLLTVAGSEIAGHDLILYVVYADNGAAVRYLDGLREKRRKARERTLQTQGEKSLKDGDFL